MKKQKKEAKILISKNEPVGLEHIKNLKSRAKEATELIRFFNQVHLLNPITTEAQSLEFLKNPIEYLNARVSSDCEITSKIQLLPSKIADLVGIDYAGISEKIGTCKLRNLKNMIFDEKAQVVEFDEKCTAAILKSFYEYSANEKESKEITKARALCKLLNEHCNRYKINSSDMNLISDRLGLKCEMIPGAKENDPENHFEFKENISVLRSVFEYEKQYE